MNNRRYVPPNFDSSQFMLFGMVRLMGLIESLALSFCIYWILSFLMPRFNPFIRILIICALTFMAFMIILALCSKESLTEKIIKRVLFVKRKRELEFRRIKERVKLEGFNPYEEDEKFSFHWTPKLKEGYTQQFIPIESIQDDMVELKDGSFVKIYEIKAANFLALSPKEQEAIVTDFERALKIGVPYIQFKVISKRSDLNPYIMRLKERTNRETEHSETLNRLAREICRQLEGMSRNTTLEHRYYIIVRVNPSFSKEKDKSLSKSEKAQLAFKEEMGVIKNRITKRGIHLAGIKEDERSYPNPSDYLVDFYYRFFNRKSSIKEDYTDRVERVTIDTKIVYGEEAEPKAIQSVAPRGMDFTSPDYIIMDGLYYTFLFVTGFPDSGVGLGWLGSFINVGEGFDFDLIVSREDKDEMRGKLKRRNILTQSNADQMSSVSLVRDETRFIASATDQMLKALEGDSEFYYFNLVCTISAPTLDKLYDKKEWIEKYFRSYNYKVEDPVYEMEEAFRLTMPFAERQDRIFKKYRRNILSAGIKAFYPFTSAALSQRDGIVLGMVKENHSALIMDFFNPISNLMVFGMTGFGKSFLAMLLAARLRIMQTQVYIIAPVKAHEYRRIARELEGSFIEIGPGSKHCINILEVRPIFKYEMSSTEDTGVITEGSYLNEKVQDLMRLFDLITENTIDRYTKDLLSPFLVEFYKSFGITDNNHSIYIDNNPKRGLKTMPIISDLEEALLDSDEEPLRKLAVPLKKFTKGNLNYFNNQTNVDLNNKFCVLDISKAMEYEDTRDLANYIVQNFVWTRVRSDRSHRKAIIYEELWKMLRNKETAETIREVFKTIRGFYGIAIGVTQNLEDLTANPFNVADGILNNTLIQIFMHNSPNEAGKLMDRFGLTEQQYGEITGLDIGEALIKTPTEEYLAAIMATKTEERLFETDGNKLARE